VDLTGGTMNITDPSVEEYATAHTTAPPAYLAALAEETTKTLDFPQMMVGALEGRFLEMLVFALGAKRILEIGTFSGYSALSMAAGMPADGRITTLEISERHADVARRHIAASPFAGRIEVVLGPALESLKTLAGPWDFVFIDADKTNYRNYYEAVLPELAPSGVIAVDNVLWSGRVVDADDTSGETKAIREFNDAVLADRRVTCVLCPVRDGVMLVRRSV
jgi:caffeoyl-CoA O-methyltransferase